MILQKIFYITILILIVLSAAVMGQEIIRPSLVGARNAAMGDADISGAYNINGMYQNPALNVFLNESSIAVNHSQIKNGLGMSESLAFPVLQNHSQSLSMGFEVFHLGYINNPAEFSGQHILEYGYDIAFASAISPTFSVGISASLRDGNANNSQTLAAGYSIGMDYSPSADINYGVVFKGIGSDVQYLLQDTLLSAISVNAPRILEIGASMSYPSSSSLRRKFFYLSLANEKIFGKTGVFYKVGIDVLPVDFLSLRFGFVSGPHVSEPRYGLGIRINSFMIEYVYYPQLASAMLEQLSISFDL